MIGLLPMIALATDEPVVVLRANDPVFDADADAHRAFRRDGVVFVPAQAMIERIGGRWEADRDGTYHLQYRGEEITIRAGAYETWFNGQPLPIPAATFVLELPTRRDAVVMTPLKTFAPLLPGELRAVLPDTTEGVLEAIPWEEFQYRNRPLPPGSSTDPTPFRQVGITYVPLVAWAKRIGATVTTLRDAESRRLGITYGLGYRGKVWGIARHRLMLWWRPGAAPQWQVSDAVVYRPRQVRDAVYLPISTARVITDQQFSVGR